MAAVVHCDEATAKSRHLDHKVVNLTRSHLVLVLDRHESGRWSRLPAPAVRPLSSVSHCTCNRNNEVTGTTGAYVYRLSVPSALSSPPFGLEDEVDNQDVSRQTQTPFSYYIAFFYGNPLVGSFKAGVKAYDAEPTPQQLLVDYGAVSAYRTEVLFGAGVHALFTAVAIPGSTVVFEVRESSHLHRSLPSNNPLAPPPCRWHGISFTGDDDCAWPARFLFRGMRHNRWPTVGPRRVIGANPLVAEVREVQQRELRVTAVNLDEVPRGADVAAAVMSLMVEFNVVCMLNAQDGRMERAIEQMHDRGVAVIRRMSCFYFIIFRRALLTCWLCLDGDLAIMCEFPVMEELVIPFRVCETTLVHHATGFIFIRLLLPHGGSCSLILFRLQSSTRPMAHTRRLSLGSSVASASHGTEMAATRLSQALDIASFIRARGLAHKGGVLLVGDVGVRPPPPLGPEFTRANAGAPTGNDWAGRHASCACMCCSCEYATLRDTLWQASSASTAVDLFRDARMDVMASRFMELVSVTSDPWKADPTVLADLQQGQRTRWMWLSSPGDLAFSFDNAYADDAANAAPRIPVGGGRHRPMEIGLERSTVAVPLLASRLRQGQSGGAAELWDMEVAAVYLADNSDQAKRGLILTRPDSVLKE
ncbi:hypothetical protein BC828DRAFT_387400 [Blastocladiella britannica]|nr:hypothetical protein BC828DRAFT_387400 [Blastocladiella britannica]